MRRIVIIAGSEKDRGYAERIENKARLYGIDTLIEICSAHRDAQNLLDVVKRYDRGNTVFITVAGKSNALSGVVAGAVFSPVIASPPDEGEFLKYDIFSSLRMPSGISPMTVLGAENSALAAARIIALNSSGVRKQLESEKSEGPGR